MLQNFVAENALTQNRTCFPLVFLLLSGTALHHFFKMSTLAVCPEALPNCSTIVLCKYAQQSEGKLALFAEYLSSNTRATSQQT